MVGKKCKSTVSLNFKFRLLAAKKPANKHRKTMRIFLLYSKSICVKDSQMLKKNFKKILIKSWVVQNIEAKISLRNTPYSVSKLLAQPDVWTLLQHTHVEKWAYLVESLCIPSATWKETPSEGNSDRRAKIRKTTVHSGVHRWRLKSWPSDHDGDQKAPPAAKYTNTASQKSTSTTRSKSAGHARRLPVSAWGCCCFAAEHTGQHSPSGVSVVWQSPTSSQTTSSHNTVPLSHKHTRQGSGLHIWSLG